MLFLGLFDSGRIQRIQNMVYCKSQTKIIDEKNIKRIHNGNNPFKLISFIKIKF